MRPARTEGSAPSMPAMQTTAEVFCISGRRFSRRCSPATPTSLMSVVGVAMACAVSCASCAMCRSDVPAVTMAMPLEVRGFGGEPRRVVFDCGFVVMVMFLCVK